MDTELFKQIFSEALELYRERGCQYALVRDKNYTRLSDVMDPRAHYFCVMGAFVRKANERGIILDAWVDTQWWQPFRATYKSLYGVGPVTDNDATAINYNGRVNIIERVQKALDAMVGAPTL